MSEPASDISAAAASGMHKKEAKRHEYKQRQTRERPKRTSNLPQKKYYRQRAHANPFSDHTLQYPVSPAHMDWSPYFAAHTLNGGVLNSPVRILDIGCGFGGLLLPLSTMFPADLIVGLELRVNVVAYAWERILALRQSAKSEYENVAALRTNAMRFLPNFIPRATLSHVFVCFPDPHFKARKHKARILSAQLLSVYAFVLRPGGLILTVTDVEELAAWMRQRLDASGLFEQVVVGTAPDELRWSEHVDVAPELRVRECVEAMGDTEEGRKVSRNGGQKYVAVYRRVENPSWK